VKNSLAGLTILFALLAIPPAAAAQDPSAHEPAPTKPIRITSPLGRTGVIGTVRIVAQIERPAKARAIAKVSFFVDGALVGTVENGPPYAVAWIDENPFEPRQIAAEAVDTDGVTMRDTVTLPPFQIDNRTEIASVLLEASVYDAHGKFATNFDESTFVVREDGVVQAIDLVRREALGANTVLLVDNSSSMARRMDVVRRVAERFAATLHEGDRVIVAPFNAHLGTLTGPTDDPKTISESIQAMRGDGGTAFLDGILEAVKLLEGLDGRRSIILITDGYDENSVAKLNTVLTRVQGAHTTIYSVGIGGVAGISLEGERMLRMLAEQTGGSAYFPARDAAVTAAAETVAADVHNRYLIAYTSANQKKDGTWRTVAVDAPRGYTVRTRTGYRAQLPPPIRPTIEFIAKSGPSGYVDLALDSFEVLEDGVVQSVDTFQEAVDPVAIVLTLDASGSMKPAADMVKVTAREFVTAVRPEDTLALITFADEPVFAHVLATDRQMTLDAIEKYTPLGGTALYDGLWNSLMHLKSVSGRRAIVVLTDGRDENNPGTAPGSAHTFAEVLELARQIGAAIFPIGLGAKVERPVLERLAAVSGGEAYFSPDPSRLGEQFRMITENLRRRYVVSYTSTNPQADGAWRTVEIRPKARAFQALSTGGYFAPEQ
jgi:VWFA-related protein